MEEYRERYCHNCGIARLHFRNRCVVCDEHIITQILDDVRERAPDVAVEAKDEPHDQDREK